MASTLASTMSNLHARQLVLTSSQRTSNGIEKNLCSLEYVTVDHIAAGVYILGKGAMLAKLDIKSAYRIVPFIQRIVRY